LEMEIGARGLRSVMEKIMTNIMYTAPSDPTISGISITKECVWENTEPELIRRKIEIDIPA